MNRSKYRCPYRLGKESMHRLIQVMKRTLIIQAVLLTLLAPGGAAAQSFQPATWIVPTGRVLGMDVGPGGNIYVGGQDWHNGADWPGRVLPVNWLSIAFLASFNADGELLWSRPGFNLDGRMAGSDRHIMDVHEIVAYGNRLFTNEGLIFSISVINRRLGQKRGRDDGSLLPGRRFTGHAVFWPAGFDGAELSTRLIRPVSSGDLNWMPLATCTLSANSWIRCAWRPARCFCRENPEYRFEPACRPGQLRAWWRIPLGAAHRWHQDPGRVARANRARRGNKRLLHG